MSRIRPGQDYRKHHVSFVCSQAEFEAIRVLSAIDGVKQSTLIRTLLKSAYDAVIKNRYLNLLGEVEDHD